MNDKNEMRDLRDTFDLLELIQQVKKYLWIVILATFVMGCIGFMVSKYFIEPEYEAATTMIVNTKQDNTTVVTNDNITSAQNLVSTYAVIVKSNTVLEQVIRSLNLDMTYDELEDHVYVNAVDDTQIMRVAVRNSDRELAGKIVESISNIAPDIIVDTVEAGSCKVISKVKISSRPVTPNVKKNTLLMAALGFMLSIVFVVIMTLFRVKKIVDDNDVQKQIGLTVLGVIPEVEGVNKKNKRQERKNKKVRTPRKLTLVTQKNVPFNYREAYKSLRTNVKFVSNTTKANSFVITSALQMESKSNVSTNFAITLAEEGKRVILLDCDFRKPTIHRFMHVNTSGKGLTDVIMRECAVEKAIYHVTDWNIDVLPIGTIPPNPTELLSSKEMQIIVTKLKELYDYVIIDTPPVSVVTDAAIIGGMVDGAFLVVRSDFAPTEMIRLAKKKLEDVNVKIFGVVLSRFDAKKTGRQSGYYYSYGNYYYSYDKDGYGYSSDEAE